MNHPAKIQWIEGAIRILSPLLICIQLSTSAFTQVADTMPSTQVLKTLSLEELLNIRVTSVSKQPELLSKVASAIQVITADDIKRSGASNLPEALRLAPNLQVAQIRSNAWIISARGFNAPFSNKLLVLIDGRTVYSPLFAGVFWDAQSVLLEDIDRIEVISGPGATLWGANAVNGVINIITKNAKDTKGLYSTVVIGNFLKDHAALRYGGKTKGGLAYRAFIQHSNYENTFLGTGGDNTDDWNLTQGGFRLDWSPAESASFMIQGNIYGGVQKTEPDKSPYNGQNILGRYSRSKTPGKEFSLEFYFDRTWRRDIPSTITDKMITYDIDLQDRFPIGKQHSFMWGAGYRFMHNEIVNGNPVAGFLPLEKDLNLFSAFIQDEISLADSKFKLTIGTKLQHYTYSDFSVQPSLRFAWTPINNKPYGPPYQEPSAHPAVSL